MINIIRNQEEFKKEEGEKFILCIGSLNRCISEGIAEKGSLLGSIALSKDNNKVMMMVKRRPNGDISIPATEMAVRRLLYLAECNEKGTLLELSKRQFRTESEADDVIATIVNVCETILRYEDNKNVYLLIKDEIDDDMGEI